MDAACFNVILPAFSNSKMASPPSEPGASAELRALAVPLTLAEERALALVVSGGGNPAKGKTGKLELGNGEGTTRFSVESSPP